MGHTHDDITAIERRRDEPFVEVHVPLEMRDWIARSFKPTDGRDFRVLLKTDGSLSVFPSEKLSADELSEIFLFLTDVVKAELPPRKPSLWRRLKLALLRWWVSERRGREDGHDDGLQGAACRVGE